jgi:hypothetical protein
MSHLYKTASTCALLTLRKTASLASQHWSASVIGASIIGAATLGGLTWAFSSRHTEPCDDPSDDHGLHTARPQDIGVPQDAGTELLSGESGLGGDDGRLALQAEPELANSAPSTYLSDAAELRIDDHASFNPLSQLSHEGVGHSQTLFGHAASSTATLTAVGCDCQ